MAGPGIAARHRLLVGVAGVVATQAQQVGSFRRSKAASQSTMTIVASFDVGTASLGLAIYHAESRKILAWERGSIRLRSSTYMLDIASFDEQHCKHHPIDVVLLEKQLRHVNHQMGRLEANLEGYYSSQGKKVLLLDPGLKYSSHGLQLPDSIVNRFNAWKTAAIQRSTAGRLSTSQSTRLNKKKAQELTSFFLQLHTQEVAVQTQYDRQDKQDDLADALIQALAYCNVVLRISPHPPSVIVID